MKFIDEIQIQVQAGKGGAGCVSFLHEKYREFGGPDGGDGGRGGDVYLEAHSSLQSLSPFQSKRHWKAEDGSPGRGKKKSGKDGACTTILLPVGTEVLELVDETTGRLVADLNRPGMRICVARGGLGGRGNCHFATSTNQTPEYAQPGLPGEEKKLKLSLKLLADVGLVGLPNAGKSTLLAAVSHNLPKIADYAFTTLAPNIGVVETADAGSVRRLLLADIPGIIEGASKGLGLGLSFLRHIERVQLIVYVIDGSKLNAAAEIRMLRSELINYSKQLIERPALIVFNKMDEFSYDKELARESLSEVLQKNFWEKSKQAPPQVLFISAKEKYGTEEFKRALFSLLPNETLAERSLRPYKKDELIAEASEGDRKSSGLPEKSLLIKDY